MPADMDSAPAVVITSPLTLDPVAAVFRTEVSPHPDLRAASSDFPLPPLTPFPLTTSTRLSILSVYLI